MSGRRARGPSAHRLAGGGALLSVIALAGCVGELPEADYPCLVAQGHFDTYNEAYVFSPGGDKQATVERAQRAEEDCQQDRQ